MFLTNKQQKVNFSTFHNFMKTLPHKFEFTSDMKHE